MLHSGDMQTCEIVNPLGLDVAEEDPAELIPMHDADRADDLAAITASMRENGWQGAPLVTLGGITLLTGCHRTQAAIAAGIAVPCVDIAAMFAAAGIDLDEEALRDAEREAVLYDLPAAVRDAYGIDL